MQNQKRKARVEKVTQLLSGVHYKTQEEKNQAILSFSKANLSIGEIENLVIPLNRTIYKVKCIKRGMY